MWMRSFERHTEKMGVEERRRILLKSLSDDCLDHLEDLLLKEKPKAPYSEIRTALLNLFARPCKVHEPMMLLMSRVQSEEENLYQYVGSLKKLAHEAFSSDKVKVDEIIRDRFIRGIRDRRVKDKLCELNDLSLNDAVEMASECDSKFRMVETLLYRPKVQCIMSNPDREPLEDEIVSTVLETTPRSRCQSVDLTSKTSLELVPRKGILKLPALTPSSDIKGKSVQIHQVNKELDRSQAIRGVGKINNQLIVFDVDTGADITAISEEVFLRLNPRPKLTHFEARVLSAGDARSQINSKK